MLFLQGLIHDRRDVFALVAVGGAHNHGIDTMRCPLAVQVVQYDMLWPWQCSSGIHSRWHIQERQLQVRRHDWRLLCKVLWQREMVVVAAGHVKIRLATLHMLNADLCDPFFACKVYRTFFLQEGQLNLAVYKISQLLSKDAHHAATLLPK